MKDYFWTVFDAAAGTLKGLWITLRYLFKPAITVQYPDEKLVPYPLFRGALLFDASSCTGCALCARACPSSCIAMESRKDEAGKRIPKVEWYSIDFGRCNFCRLCEEACPESAAKPKSLWHSLDYELVFNGRSEMVRYWKEGFEWTGRIQGPAGGEFSRPADHLSVQTVPARR
jgi:NADH-quinone oxidoreductase subunit I